MGRKAKLIGIPWINHKTSKKCCACDRTASGCALSPPGGNSRLLCQQDSLVGGMSERLRCIPPPREGQLPSRTVQEVSWALKAA